MPNALRLPFLAAMVSLSLILGACSCSEDSAPMSHFEGLVGSWTGVQTMAGDANEYIATYKITFADGVLVHEFESNFGDGFWGREELSFDAESAAYQAIWSDSSESDPNVTTGTFDAASRTLTMKGNGADFQDPQKAVQYVHTTTYGENEMDYTMTTVSEDGVANEVMQIKMTRDS